MMKEILIVLFFITGSYGRLVGQTTICPGDTLILKASSINADGYDWYRNDRLIANEHADRLRITTTGSYSVVAFNKSGCYSDTSEMLFIRERILKANDDTARTHATKSVAIQVEANDWPGCYPLDGNTVTIIKQPEKGIASIKRNSIITYFPFSYASGSDKILYTIKDDAGNISNVAVVNISIGEECAVVFPNPFKDRVQVNLTNPFIDHLKVFEMGGKMVYSSEIIQLNNSIDLHFLADGVYTLCLYEDGSKVCIYKLIKESN